MRGAGTETSEASESGHEAGRLVVGRCGEEAAAAAQGTDTCASGRFNISVMVDLAHAGTTPQESVGFEHLVLRHFIREDSIHDPYGTHDNR